MELLYRVRVSNGRTPSCETQSLPVVGDFSRRFALPSGQQLRFRCLSERAASQGTGLPRIE
jgi:hypothetical protein